MSIKIISYKTKQRHVSQDTVKEFEVAIVNSGVKKQLVKSFTESLGIITLKILKRITINVNYNRFKSAQYHFFCILMGTEFQKAIIPFAFNKSNSIYIFDAWLDTHYLIELMIKKMNLKYIFFSSKQVTEIFQKKGLSCNFIWVPEGINISDYRYEKYKNKDIDVLSFGRKYDVLHNKIVNELENSNIKYLYEQKKGDIIFPTRESFIDGLSRTKISICIPSNVTHPGRAGSISTMTVRYLQSMASKCLILGYMPDEMMELFDYCPIIEINDNDAVNQIKIVLERFDEYLPLIEKNYEVITNHHTWGNRWDLIKKHLTLQNL